MVGDPAARARQWPGGALGTAPGRPGRLVGSPRGRRWLGPPRTNRDRAARRAAAGGEPPCRGAPHDEPGRRVPPSGPVAAASLPLRGRPPRGRRAARDPARLRQSLRVEVRYRCRGRSEHLHVHLRLPGDGDPVALPVVQDAGALTPVLSELLLRAIAAAPRSPRRARGPDARGWAGTRHCGRGPRSDLAGRDEAAAGDAQQAQGRKAVADMPGGHDDPVAAPVRSRGGGAGGCRRVVP